MDVTMEPHSPSKPESSSEEEEYEDDSEKEDGEQVMSEVHLGCPPGASGPHLSHFAISLPPGVESRSYSELFGREKASTQEMISVDEDGDLILTRRNSTQVQSYVFTIRHNIKSSIPSVGLQIWKAELVLSDFVLHKMATCNDFDEIIALELGAGTGLVGILLAHVAKTVFITDRGDEILDNCAENVRINELNYQAAVYVRELDWMDPWPPQEVVSSNASQSRYSWNPLEIEEAQEASVLLAADVIYSDDLTDALFNILQRLMSVGSEKVLYLALEKRYNFSLDDLDVVANGYSRFRSYIQDETDCGTCDVESCPRFVGKCINIGKIPQYVGGYNRGNDIELWQIKYNSKNRNSLSL